MGGGGGGQSSPTQAPPDLQHRSGVCLVWGCDMGWGDTWGDTELKRGSTGGATARPPPNHHLFSAVGGTEMETARPDTQRHGQTGPAQGGSHAVRLPDRDGDSDGDEETMGGGGYTPCCAGSYLPRRMFLGWGGRQGRGEEH